jgi:hypothetical protein
MTPVLYLIMRDDLPSLNPGKLAAQAAHCANACVAKMRKADSAMLRKWERESSQDFGTTIVLGAGRRFIASLPNKVWDDTYPCGDGALRKVLVGAFLLTDRAPKHLARLELYP